MRTKPWAILIVLVTTALTSAGQVFYKFGTNALPDMPGIFDYVFNIFIVSGLFVYFVGAVLLVIALKHGELSVLYPIIATSYIWVSVFSIIFFAEQMSTLKWLGVFIIVIGVSLIGIGGSTRFLKLVSKKEVAR